MPFLFSVKMDIIICSENKFNNSYVNLNIEHGLIYVAEFS